MIRRSYFFPFFAGVALVHGCFSTSGDDDSAGCKKDTDCAAGRICSTDGRCTDANGAGAGSSGRGALAGSGGAFDGTSGGTQSAGSGGAPGNGTGGTGDASSSGGSGGTAESSGGTGAASSGAGRGGSAGKGASSAGGNGTAGTPGGGRSAIAGADAGGVDNGASGAAGAAACSVDDPITCPSSDSMTLCLNGSEQTLTCDYACAELGFETGPCAEPDGCACGSPTDEACADGVNVYCTCVANSSTPCDANDPNNDPLNFYLECHGGTNQADTDFLKCLAMQASGMSQIDCKALATACDPTSSN